MPTNSGLTNSDLNGIILLDKPLGYSSNAILQRVKKLLGVQKAGHTGTLDPDATGMLPICLNEATKVIRFLLDASKAYTVKIALGHTTTTADAQGSVLLSRPVAYWSLDKIESLLTHFRGDILQVPPVYSALKQDGKRYYELARQGRASEIKRTPRAVHIHKLSLLHYDYQNENTAFLELMVHCSKGTYIRSLAQDIGEAMGCGAHVIELRRVFVEPFESYPMLSMEKLVEICEQGPRAALDMYLLEPPEAIAHLEKIEVSPEEYIRLYQGQKISRTTCSHEGWVQLWSQSPDQFFGVGHKTISGEIVPKRLFKFFNLSELC